MMCEKFRVSICLCCYLVFHEMKHVEKLGEHLEEVIDKNRHCAGYVLSLILNLIYAVIYTFNYLFSYVSSPLFIFLVGKILTIFKKIVVRWAEKYSFWKKNTAAPFEFKNKIQILIIKNLWIQKNTSERPKQESFRISDIPKNDLFWGFLKPQIPEQLGDINNVYIVYPPPPYVHKDSKLYFLCTLYFKTTHSYWYIE